MDHGLDYELLDVGDGARLERFGDRILDRPHPTALAGRADPGAWRSAGATFDREHGWRGPGPLDPWTIRAGPLTLELRLAPAGQVGVFPEQAESWRWLAERVAERADPAVLHLFAYTGAATVAMAATGARVTHVDASRPSVAWARRNAERSGLAGAPVRWLIDDAAAFVARERRRGRRYAGLVLDPPTYGHGPSGSAWRIVDGLLPLLDSCASIVDAEHGFVLLTAHTPGYDPNGLAALLATAFDQPRSRVEAGELALESASGRPLDLGAFARWSGGA